MSDTIRRSRWSGETLLSALVFGVFAASFLAGWFDSLEVKTLDARFRARGPEVFEEQIVLLYITDECIQKLGGWPWPRSRHAQVVNLLTKAGARLIVFDIIFRDPLTQKPLEDQQFVEACAKSGRVIFPMLVEQVKVLDPDTLRLKTEFEVVRPFRELASTALDLGFVNVEYQRLNPDGLVRRLPLTMYAKNRHQPALDLVVARNALQVPITTKSDNLMLGDVAVPLAEIPGHWLWDRETAEALPRAFLVNFLGEAMSVNFPITFYSDLVTGELDPEVFKDKIVLIGPSAAGLSDIKLTPFGEMPGVLIHANIVQNLMRRNFLWQPTIFGSAVLLFVLAVAANLCLVALSPLWSVGSVLLLILLYNGLAFALFLKAGIVLDMLVPTLMLVVQYVVGRFWQMIRNLREAYQSLQERTHELEKSNVILDMQVSELSKLNEAGRLFGQTLDLDVLGKNVLEVFKTSWNASAAILAQIEEESDSLEVMSCFGIEGDNPGAYLYDPSVVQHVAKMFAELRPVYDPRGRWFHHFIPLMLGERRWGAVLLRQDQPNSKVQDRIHFVSTLGSLAATALENSRLYNLATVDGLTKLYVRRFFQLQLEQEFKRSRRYRHRMALLMTDIDFFKRFNDTYGHQQGDIVLREVAGVVKRTLRNVDVAARYGGEEFGIILPETDLQGAIIVAERIRQNVEVLLVPHFDPIADPLHVTLSIGVAAFPEVEPDSSESLLKFADDALYVAKEGGRNKVEAARQGLEVA